jgi:two-component system, response regulator
MRQSILIVEDNPDDEVLALRAVRTAVPGVDAQVARDGFEALSFLFDGTRSSLPCFVFLDIKLPKLNGLEVLRSIRGNLVTVHLPVVILTSSSQQQDIEQAYAGGANAYVQKPVQFASYMAAVGGAASFWALYNRCPISD